MIQEENLNTTYNITLMADFGQKTSNQLYTIQVEWGEEWDEIHVFEAQWRWENEFDDVLKANPFYDISFLDDGHLVTWDKDPVNFKRLFDMITRFRYLNGIEIKNKRITVVESHSYTTNLN